MTPNEITKALIAYRTLEEQKAKLTEEQDELKRQVTDHMAANDLDTIEASGVVAKMVARTGYTFDVPAIVAAVPEAVKSLKLTNEEYLKLLKGNEDKIGGFRKVASNKKTLTITTKKEKQA